MYLRELPVFMNKTELFAHALDNNESAQPTNCSIIARPSPSLGGRLWTWDYSLHRIIYVHADIQEYHKPGVVKVIEAVELPALLTAVTVAV